MSLNTDIEFADRTANPQMGCEGLCELSPTAAAVERAIFFTFSNALPGINERTLRTVVAGAIEGHTPSDMYHLRRQLPESILTLLGVEVSHSEKLSLLTKTEDALKKLYICYAHGLHLRFAANAAKPEKIPKEGYAVDFQRPLLTPGKVAEAARAPDLFGKIRVEKPWMDYLPTITFISDMGDSFAPSTSFDYLMREVIEVVASACGVRHIWLWFTKQPRIMLEFASWMDRAGVSWPDNLVPVTSVTSRKTLKRVEFLREIPAKFRGISAEPLWEEIDLPLDGISWCVTGGQAGWNRHKPFDLNWARRLRDQCRSAGTSFFLKQLGNSPMEDGIPIRLKSATGGDWGEFPDDLRIREMPRGFYDWGVQQLFAPK